MLIRFHNGEAESKLTIQEFGYALSGNSSGDAFDLISDAKVKEHIDLGELLGSLSNFRDVAVGDGIENFIEFLSGITQATGGQSKMVEGLLNMAEHLDSVTDMVGAADDATDGALLPEKNYVEDSVWEQVAKKAKTEAYMELCTSVNSSLIMR